MIYCWKKSEAMERGNISGIMRGWPLGVGEQVRVMEDFSG